MTQPTIPGGTITPGPSLNRCVPLGSTTESRQVLCPAGQYGLTNQQRVVSYACPEAWASPVPSWGLWGTISGSCAPCPGAGQEAAAQWVGVSVGCPAGQTGSNTWEKEQRTLRSYTYSCPADTTVLPAPSFGGWGAWQDTGATRNHLNTCRATAGTWVEVGAGCYRQRDDNGSYNDCEYNGGWDAWIDIPNNTGKEICRSYADFNNRPGMPIPDCITDLVLDTRAAGCAVGSTAVYELYRAYDGGSQSGNMMDFNFGEQFTLIKYECR